MVAKVTDIKKVVGQPKLLVGLYFKGPREAMIVDPFGCSPVLALSCADTDGIRVFSPFIVLFAVITFFGLPSI